MNIWAKRAVETCLDNEKYLELVEFLSENKLTFDLDEFLGEVVKHIASLDKIEICLGAVYDKETDYYNDVYGEVKAKDLLWVNDDRIYYNGDYAREHYNDTEEAAKEAHFDMMFETQREKRLGNR